MSSWEAHCRGLVRQWDCNRDVQTIVSGRKISHTIAVSGKVKIHRLIVPARRKVYCKLWSDKMPNCWIYWPDELGRTINIDDRCIYDGKARDERRLHGQKFMDRRLEFSKPSLYYRVLFTPIGCCECAEFLLGF